MMCRSRCRQELNPNKVVRPFDELAVLELGSRADEGDGVGCVYGAPAGLGGLDVLGRRGQAGGREPGPLVALVRCRTVAKGDSGWSCADGTAVTLIADRAAIAADPGTHVS